MNKSKWMSLKAASAYLGKGWGYLTLRKRCIENELEEGKHWRDDRRPGSTKALYKINVEAIESDLCTPAGSRTI